MNRRRFLRRSAAASLLALNGFQRSAVASAPQATMSPVRGELLPDEGWNLWLDQDARWRDDDIFLPEDVELAKLPVNAPTGGWQVLHASGGLRKVVTLPATVEEHFWGAAGQRSYTPEEYRYAADDAVPQNGAYCGISWWSRELLIPAEMKGKRILLHVRGARMRAEVYLNGKLVGYSIMEELPFTCDLTDAAKPGGANLLAIRITNPGGRYDWVDGSTITWGKVNVYRSHGFGGLDRGITLEAVPMSGHLDDVWVLNTPEPRTVSIQANFALPFEAVKAPHSVMFEAVEPVTGKVVGKALAGNDPPGRLFATLHCPEAKLWDLDQPNLYDLRATLSLNGETHVRTVRFGFRWFGPTGLGEDAMFRLNGKRIKLYTAISWGYWGLNGLFPTPALAEREVTQAKKLGLTCLNFHRNVGKPDVLDAQDRLGLLRDMEPGGGKLAVGKLPSAASVNAAGVTMEAPKNTADLFSQRFMLAKCRAMVRAFRSHPSLVQYTLQNEIGADLKNPATLTPLEVMRAEDPSRCIVLNDGFVARNAAQAWFEPYTEQIHRSDREPWGGWWNNHQGAGDQWYDEFYTDAEHFTYRQPLKTALVEFGEMEGCAVTDNHSLMIDQIMSKTFGGSGGSYDLADHREILAGYQRFLDRWGFRKGFPTADALFRSLGNRCYESWQQYLENARICDEIDVAAISGWESTAIENHSGIVDNLRNFKGDPELIASSLRPVRLVAKQHHLCYAVGESAVFDLYLLNDSGRGVSGAFDLAMVDPAGARVMLKRWDAPVNVVDLFSYPIEAEFKTPAMMLEGIYRFRFTSSDVPAANFEREIWVAEAKPRFGRKLRVGVSAVLPSVRKQLEALPDVEVAELTAGSTHDVLVTSGVVEGAALNRKVGDETGLEAQPAKGAVAPPQPLGRVAEDVLARVKAGAPLLVVAPDDFLADGVAKQLAALGAFAYSGQVGDTRAPWMGNWMFVREHAAFAGLPVDRAMSIHYGTRGKQSNGLLVDGADVEVIVGYSRDHDRNVGAASFVCRVGTARVLFHRVPEMSLPLQMRWLGNSLRFLGGV